MGVQLGGLIAPSPIEFKDMEGKWIAIDAMNSLYQFLSIIRQPTGEPLMDSKGRVTSHLSGLLYRNVNLVEYGIKPVYVFDGKPPELKEGVVKGRKEIRSKAEVKWREALVKGKLEEARMFAQQASKFSDEMLKDSMLLLEYMGIPCIQAPSEGEAQASYMAQKGDCWAVGSQDYDSLLFNSPILLRNLTISGKRKVPRKNVYVDVKPEIFTLEEVLSTLEISREQLIDISILVGTDYNPHGVEGIGPKKAYSLIKEFGRADKAVKEKGIQVNFDIGEIRELFLNPEITETYSIEFRPPDVERVLSFLCDEHDFSEDRVTKAMEKLKSKVEESKSQASLDMF